jgi:hypothetical protein
MRLHSITVQRMVTFVSLNTTWSNTYTRKNSKFTNGRAYQRGGLSTFRAVCVSVRVVLERPNKKQERLGYNVLNKASSLLHTRSTQMSWNVTMKSYHTYTRGHDSGISPRYDNTLLDLRFPQLCQQRVQILWDVVPRNAVEVRWCFEGTRCLFGLCFSRQDGGTYSSKMLLNVCWTTAASHLHK